MNRVIVNGLGAVSPAGWGVAALRETIRTGSPIPCKPLVRPGWTDPLQVLQVPQPPVRPSFLAHPRLRRANAVSQFSVAAALEALGDDAALVSAGKLRLGVVLCVMTGCVAYSRRFFEETMRDPTTASPLIFPETVFNAPASHLSAYLGSNEINYTLVGDESTFISGLALAAEWLSGGRCDGCVVIGAEEMDWTVCDALRLFDKSAIHSEGAGAVYLKSERSIERGGIELESVTDAFAYTRRQSRADAVGSMRRQTGIGMGELLCVSGDVVESEAWSDWSGARLSLKQTFGTAFTASAAWQCVAACDALRGDGLNAAVVSVAGTNQAAIGTRFAACR